jgi:Plasmid pRiA4b ORF-3-like protein
MAGWMTVHVELVSGQGTDLDSRPGRVFVAGPHNTFGDLAVAINLHFARWDLAHLHLFRLNDGREIGYPDPEFPEWLDEEAVTLSEAVTEGEQFEYVFDFGDEWTHECRIEEVGLDATKMFDEEPAVPVPIWGWGSMPDQYGRQTENDIGEPL